MEIITKVTDEGGLKVDVGNYGVDIGPGYDADTLDAAFQMLVEQVAGVSKAQIGIAACKAAMSEGQPEA